MRRIPIESARRKMAQKRGARAEHVPLEEAHIEAIEPDDKLLVLKKALCKLEAQDSSLATVVKLRLFADLTVW